MPDDFEKLPTGEEMFPEVNPDGTKGIQPPPDPDPNATDDGDGGDGGTPPNPLDVVLEGMSVEDIRAKVLNDPRVRPVYQQSKDREISDNIRTTRQTMEGDVRRQVQEEAWERRISAMTPDAIKEQLANDPQFLQSYSEFVARRNDRTKAQWEKELLDESQVHSNATILEAYGKFVDESSLSAEVKASLVPENYSGQPDPMNAYVSSIIKALGEHEGRRFFEEELKKNLDAATQDKLAEADGGVPVLNGGRRTQGGMDVMEHSGEDLIGAGLQDIARQKRGGK